MDTTRVCSCGKTCKNEKGLNIHRARMGCPPVLNLEQRTRQLGETEEELDQDSHHSVQSLHAQGEAEVDSGQQDQASGGSRQRVKWPASNKAAWGQFEEDVEGVLEATLAGSVDQKIRSMTTLIYTMGADWFGCEEKGGNGKVRPHKTRRQRQIEGIRSDLRKLTRQYKTATSDQKEALEELRRELRERLIITRRAENKRKKRKERQKRRAQFVANPFECVKKLLGDTRSGRLDQPREGGALEAGTQRYKEGRRPG